MPTTPKLACPYCGGYASRVTDVRPLATEGVWRRRQCLTCQRRYSTREFCTTLKPPQSSTHHNM